MFEIINLLLNAVLSSSMIVTLVTLKSTKAKASAEADATKIDNSQKLLNNFESYIVQPLKTEVNELRKSIYRLQNAIKQIPSCPHADTCPVSAELQHQQTPHPDCANTDREP